MMIERPLTDLDSWLGYFSNAELPVLRHTMHELEKLRANAENTDGRILSAVILQDPLMTLRVLGFLEQHRHKSQNADITTIGRALMMIGVNPFFSAFENLPLVEDRLRAHPKALLGLLKVITRTRKAAHWARDWAISRHDLNVEEITVATLLYDVAEIMMWCFAPSLALEVIALLSQDPTRRSSDAQKEVYGIRLGELKRGLIHAWHLPQLLADLVDDRNAEQPRVLNVVLAVNLARHSANGWDNAALPDDFRAIENLLHINHDALLEKLDIRSST